MKHAIYRFLFAAAWILFFAPFVPEHSAAQPIAAHDSPATTTTVDAVTAIGLTVGDMDRSVKFFTEILDFQLICDVMVDPDANNESLGRVREVALSLGTEAIILRQYVDQQGAAVPADSRANDHWFQHIAIVVSDLDAAYQRLRSHKVRHASSGPQTLPDWNPNAGGIAAFYFRDPDGHFLELIQFPADKGDPRWQKPTDRLFLGIDHTAIVVADTDRSLEFYRDQLGMRVAGASENYGAEQERLNGVFAARLRITALRAERGPGVELLEYLSPTDGRALSAPLQPNDLAHWQIEMRATPSSESTEANRMEFRRDPDGHVLQISR